MDGKIILDDSRWPLLLVRIEGLVSDRAFEHEFLNNYKRYLDRGERYAVLFDGRFSGRTPPSQQRMMGEWMKRNADQMRASICGIAFIIDNILVRMVFRSILFISPIPPEHTVVKTLEDAESWCLQKLQSAGVSALR